MSGETPKSNADEKSTSARAGDETTGSGTGEATDETNGEGTGEEVEGSTKAEETGSQAEEGSQGESDGSQAETSGTAPPKSQTAPKSGISGNYKSNQTAPKSSPFSGQKSSRPVGPKSNQSGASGGYTIKSVPAAPLQTSTAASISGPSTPPMDGSASRTRARRRKKGEKVDLTNARYGFVGAGRMTDCIVKGLLNYSKYSAVFFRTDPLFYPGSQN